VAIETENKFEFSEELTPLVAASVTEAVERVLPLILEYRTVEI
jgi:Ni,Fe-hydrogenase maturation factor